jgi:hypothetical protein
MADLMRELEEGREGEVRAGKSPEPAARKKRGNSTTRAG